MLLYIYLSPFFTLFGALIIAFSIGKLYASLKYYSGYTQRTQGISSILNLCCLIMMNIFFLGYLIFAGYLILSGDMNTISFFVSVIFLLGSVFVCCMVMMQIQMSHTISQRSLETIHSLISAVEAKDVYTRGHSDHVRHIIDLFYHHLPADYQAKINLDMLLDAAMLHDIGKIGIPDSILNKQGPLTPDEYDIIKQHPKRGYEILEQTVYRKIAFWILYHHERVDGKGYYGIKNEELPLEAKMLSVADTFSALYTDRVYRKRFSFEKAVAIMKECAGTQLDAELTDIFCTIDKSELCPER